MRREGGEEGGGEEVTDPRVGRRVRAPAPLLRWRVRTGDHYGRDEGACGVEYKGEV